jgi:hypothetical protein
VLRSPDHWHWPAATSPSRHARALRNTRPNNRFWRVVADLSWMAEGVQIETDRAPQESSPARPIVQRQPHGMFNGLDEAAMEHRSAWLPAGWVRSGPRAVPPPGDLQPIYSQLPATRRYRHPRAGLTNPPGLPVCHQTTRHGRVRSPSQGGDTGSNPVGAARSNNRRKLAHGHGPPHRSSHSAHAEITGHVTRRRSHEYHRSGARHREYSCGDHSDGTHDTPHPDGEAHRSFLLTTRARRDQSRHTAICDGWRQSADV